MVLVLVLLVAEAVSGCIGNVCAAVAAIDNDGFRVMCGLHMLHAHQDQHLVIGEVVLPGSSCFVGLKRVGAVHCVRFFVATMVLVLLDLVAWDEEMTVQS